MSIEGEWGRWGIARKHERFAKWREKSQQKGICRKARDVDGQPSTEEELIGPASAEKERGMSLATETTASMALHLRESSSPMNYLLW